MKFVKIIFVIIILSIVANGGNAQNLVPNPSFEIYSTCPTSFSQINRATPWYDPTHGSSDYFNACSTGYANVPFCSNGNGYQFARTGVAYAGLYALNLMGDGGREYIQIQLAAPLIYDSCYFVEFYCSLGNDMGYSINKLGAYLSDTAIHYTGPGSISVLHYTPQVVSTSFLTDTVNWMHISGYYQANGGEKFLTIGDFKSFAAGDTLNTGIVGYAGAYYLIDDVSITKVAGCDTVGTGINELQSNTTYNLYPNPSNGNMTLEYKLNATDHATIQMFDIAGKKIADYVLATTSNKLLLNCTTLDNGIYFYRLIINNKTEAYDKLIIIK